MLGKAVHLFQFLIINDTHTDSISVSRPLDLLLV